MACGGEAPIAAEIHQPLDVDRDLAAKIALDHVVAVDRLANLQDFRVRQLGDPPPGGNMHLSQISSAFFGPMPWIY